MVDSLQDLEALDWIERAVELGSLRAVASEWGTARSAPSVKLKRLEAWLGVKLLERTTRSLKLTRAGQVYCRRYRKIYQELLEARREVQLAPFEQRSPEPAPPPPLPYSGPERFDLVVRRLPEGQWAASCRPFELIAVGADIPEVLRRIYEAISAELGAAKPGTE